MDSNRFSDVDLSAEAVVAKLREEAASIRKKKRFLNLLMFVVLIGAVLSIVYERLGSTPAALSSIEPFLPWSLVLVGGGLAMARKQLLATAQEAAAFGDKRALAPTIELLNDPDPDAGELAAQVVIRLLPKFDANDFSALSNEQRRQLLTSMRKSSSPLFVGTVVGAAKKYGGADCIAPLEDFLLGNIALDKATGEYARNLVPMALADIRMRVAKDRIDNNIGVVAGVTASQFASGPPEDDGQRQSTSG